MGLFDTFWAKIECPYRDHEVEAGFQTKAFSDRVLRNVKVGDSVSSWTLSGGPGIQAELSDGTHEVLLLDGLTDCEKCRKINSVVGLDDGYGFGRSFMFNADIVLMDRKFVGIAHVRPDVEYFRRVVLSHFRLPAEPVLHWPAKNSTTRKRDELEHERYGRKLDDLERRLKLKLYLLRRMR